MAMMQTWLFTDVVVCDVMISQLYKHRDGV